MTRDNEPYPSKAVPVPSSYILPRETWHSAPSEGKFTATATQAASYVSFDLLSLLIYSSSYYSNRLLAYHHQLDVVYSTPSGILSTITY